MRKYSESHEWVEIRGATARVGITQHAAEEVGEVVFIDLPQLGEELKQGQVACVLESTKAAIDVTTPVSGKVAVINHACKNQLEILNRSPEKEGWLYELESFDLQEFEHLLGEEDYQKMVNSSRA